MVTDAQSALGLSMDESTELVNKMAMASSKSNTSVEQLGDAILTVGGTAKNLAGGTTELSTALGILADNGVKGAEGGTALRNIILSLSAPTDKAAAAMQELGLEVFDAEGNMRPLNETFGDLNGILGTMSQEERIKLCVDICRRNGKRKLLWLGDKGKTLAYEPKPDEMVLTVHRWFDNKSCPGSWMYARMGDLAEKVTAHLGGSADTKVPTTQLYRVRKAWSDSKTQRGAYKNLDNARKCADANPGYSVFDAAGKSIYTPGAATPFTVKVSIPDLRIRSGPGTDTDATGKFTGSGVFTITEVKNGPGSDKGWGRLKSGAGWIALDYATEL